MYSVVHTTYIVNMLKLKQLFLDVCEVVILLTTKSSQACAEN